MSRRFNPDRSEHRSGAQTTHSFEFFLGPAARQAGHDQQTPASFSNSEGGKHDRQNLATCNVVAWPAGSRGRSLAVGPERLQRRIERFGLDGVGNGMRRSGCDERCGAGNSQEPQLCGEVRQRAAGLRRLFVLPCRQRQLRYLRHDVRRPGESRGPLHFMECEAGLNRWQSPRSKHADGSLCLAQRFMTCSVVPSRATCGHREQRVMCSVS
jgi:hypothetical protein